MIYSRVHCAARQRRGHNGIGRGRRRIDSGWLFSHSVSQSVNQSVRGSVIQSGGQLVSHAKGLCLCSSRSVSDCFCEVCVVFCCTVFLTECILLACLSVSLPGCLFLYLIVCVSDSSVYVCLCLSLPPSLSICLSACFCISLSL